MKFITIGTIQKVPIIKEVADDGTEIVRFTADMDVDCDGIGGNPDHDRYYQPETTLRHKGKSLNAAKVPFGVTPPIVVKRTTGIVFGSRLICRNKQNGRVVEAVVGDEGPMFKIGEGSTRLCELLGLDPNPNHGGTSDFIIEYEIHVGVPAVIDGETYELQKA